MGHPSRPVEFRIGLYDTDLSILSSHLTSFFDYVMLVADVTNFIITRSHITYIPNQKYSGELVCHYERKTISRIIIRHHVHKIVSFRFPFEIKQYNSQISIYFNNIQINSYIAEKLKEITLYLNQAPRLVDGVLTPFTLIDASNDLGNDDSDPIDDYIFAIYNHILFCEPGYLRYDFDQKNSKGLIHPIHHIDINYDKLSTFKYGLYEAISMRDFEKIFIRREEKFFLHKYRENKMMQLRNWQKRKRR